MNVQTEFFPDTAQNPQEENARLRQLISGVLIAKSIVTIVRNNEGNDRGWLVTYRVTP